MRVPRPWRIRAKTEAQAKQRYVGFLRQAARCVSPSADLRIGEAAAGDGRIFALDWFQPVVARRPDGGSLFIRIEQALMLESDPWFPRERKFRTLQYFYGVREHEDGDEFLYWHWNPADARWSYPHIHTAVEDPAGRSMRLHIPSGGRVSIEQVLLFLLRENLVVPEHPDWESTLAEGHGRFRYAQRG